MANDHTAIGWCDASWNPTTGCDRVSAGCDHCYALTLAARLKSMGQKRYQKDGDPKTSGPGFGLTLHPDTLTIPLRWTKPRRIFVNSMSDLFHPDVPRAFIAAVFAVMGSARQHTFQVLTKRPQRMRNILRDPTFHELIDEQADELAGQMRWCHLNLPDEWPYENVWAGTSVENQEAAYRIDFLAQTPAAIRFLSCEPLIGSLDLHDYLWDDADRLHIIDWVIVGGESGPGYRPMDRLWAHRLRNQCVNADVAFFFKQNSGERPGRPAGHPELDSMKEFPETRHVEQAALAL